MVDWEIFFVLTTKTTDAAIILFLDLVNITNVNREFYVFPGESFAIFLIFAGWGSLGIKYQIFSDKQQISNKRQPLISAALLTLRSERTPPSNKNLHVLSVTPQKAKRQHLLEI